MLGGIGAALVIGGIWWSLANAGYEDTDDAAIEAHVIQVSPKISAHVKAVHFDDNYAVKRGDLLIELDPRDFEVNLASAQSKLAEAEAQQSVARAGLGQTRADLARAQAGRPTGNQCTLTRFLDMISKRMSIAFRLEPVTASLWLPAGNATGNFVKVVQRVPVKIVFDEPSGNLDRLWAGESVEPRVHVDAPGARESLANPLPRQFWVRGREMRGER